jgi:hypothetical protein
MLDAYSLKPMISTGTIKVNDGAGKARSGTAAIWSWLNPDWVDVIGRVTLSETFRIRYLLLKNDSFTSFYLGRRYRT